MSRPPEILIKLGFIVGWLLFIVMFFLAAAESSVGQGLFTPAHEVFLALDAGKWITFKAKYASPFFDAVVMPVLSLPGWVITGVPAGFFLWFCRPYREKIDPEVYESLTTYDRLAAMADEEGAQNDDPSFKEFDLKDYEADTPEAALTSEEKKQVFKARTIREAMSGGQVRGPMEQMQKSREGLSIPFDRLK